MCKNLGININLLKVHNKNVHTRFEIEAHLLQKFKQVKIQIRTPIIFFSKIWAMTLEITFSDFLNLSCVAGMS